MYGGIKMLENLEGRPSANKIFGVVIGIVVDNKDPEGLYRIKVKFPWIKEKNSKYTDSADKEDFLSTWARITTFMSGNDMGSFWLPEVDDEVLVAFEHGDLRRPFVIGSLWNGVDKAIHDNKSQNGKNNYRSIKSRSGHMITFFDDKDNKKEKIIIQTKTAKEEETKDPMSRDGHMIVLDHSNGAEKIEIYDRKKEDYILIDMTNKKITMESKNGDILISAPNGEVKIKCKTLVTESSSTSTQKSQSAYTIQSNSTMDIKSSSGMTIKGSTVNIN
jgi:uncharacterized protein involved in type VI secretion and phage assembly